jgi:hypothetical protein
MAQKESSQTNLPCFFLLFDLYNEKLFRSMSTRWQCWHAEEHDMVDLSLILLKIHFINGELLRCAPSTKTSSIYEYFTLFPP